MPIRVFVVVLFAAALHAAWNAMVKGGGDKLLTTVLVTGSASVLAAATLPWLHAPERASWPFIAASAVLQVLYFILVARTYEIADMSQTYPLMRGTARYWWRWSAQSRLGSVCRSPCGSVSRSFASGS